MATTKTVQIARLAEATGMPLVRAMVQLLAGPLDGRHTLLAVCPNSEAVTRAALLAAREADAPLLFAATLNQVDVDGGYTGWTPGDLARFVDRERERLCVDVPVLLCLDHGGPWKKDSHVVEDYSFDETFGAVKRSLEACLDAGYALLHLDPTVDRRLPPGRPVPTRDVVERTLALLDHAEAYRTRRGLPAVAYEVGTEEVGAGLKSEERFAAFVDALGQALDARGLPRPSFVVGDVGTALHTDHFDAGRARQLGRHARRLGALVKGHFTDGVDNPEDYPLSGVGGANVGPGFASEEHAALLDLVSLERKLGYDSGLPEALAEAVVQSDRWRKWLQANEEGCAFHDLTADRQAWLIRTGSRYVWTQRQVVEARARLYDNVSGHRDAEAFVTWRVKTAILRYFHAFNLIHFNDRLIASLPLLAV